MKIVKSGPHFKLAQNCTETGTLNANCTKVTLIEWTPVKWDSSHSFIHDLVKGFHQAGFWVPWEKP
jgi:hypothetical protein